MTVQPNCRITTSKNPQNTETTVLLEELQKIIPDSTVLDIDCPFIVKIVEQRARPYSIVISKNDCSVDLQIMEYKSLKKLKNKAEPYSHLYPELVCNGFSSEIGNLFMEYIVGIFPIEVENMGNRVASFNAKNDYIFFRLYRYAFKDSSKVDFQDVGPHLTLRIRKITRQGEVQFINYKDHEFDGKNHIL